MTQAEKDRLREINRQIEILQAEKAKQTGITNKNNISFFNIFITILPLILLFQICNYCILNYHCYL